MDIMCMPDTTGRTEGSPTVQDGGLWTSQALQNRRALMPQPYYRKVCDRTRCVAYRKSNAVM